MAENANIRTEIIRPFLESTLNVLKTMAFLDVKPGKPFLKEGDSPAGDVSGIIGMAGKETSGSMALIFPKAIILKIVSNMLYEEYTEVNKDVLDCVGELTNMISGGARAGLAKQGLLFEMAIPTMITGEHHLVEHKTQGSVVCIPFDVDGDTFYIEATFIKNG